jgi:hypothetical protein
MGVYTRAVPGQRLSKYVPVARQQILNNATDRLQQWEWVVSAWSVSRSYLQTKLGRPSSVQKSVKRGVEPEEEE